MKQSPSWEADSRERNFTFFYGTQKSIIFFTKAYYCMIPWNTLTPCFFKIHLNIILLSMSKISQVIFSSWTSVLLYLLTCPFHASWCDYFIKFGAWLNLGLLIGLYDDLRSVTIIRMNVIKCNGSGKLMDLKEVVVVDFIGSVPNLMWILSCITINLARKSLKTANNSYHSTVEIFLHKNMLKQPCEMNLLVILSSRILSNTGY